MANQSNNLVVPQAKAALNQMKYEIATEHGIQLSEGYNGNLMTREAGTIGGNITKRLVQMAEQSLSGASFNTRR
ncbi:alpha/beta-type small acid-soluble spore protein [Paenibacillus glycanilyticus]|uniref:Small acid-soluble spore protein n=1 Tax=Paenibacillus glycanilyticus TaxID=126569 RepID=A0ABQ6GNM7_9BACL|nr:alpha/beta-type small acid-soluble spore protein [Paenibacillus glycanilyticus]GLX70627.1 small acid-soluble spore protein [Paenibacillus glycanilyticus]